MPDARRVDDLVEAFATVTSAAEFWANVAAVLTDEVVILEAQAVGMDWPELEDGRRRLLATRHAVVQTAQGRRWITPAEAHDLTADDAHRALAAARPRIEREQERSLGETRALRAG